MKLRYFKISQYLGCTSVQLSQTLWGWDLEISILFLKSLHGSVIKEAACQCRRREFDPWVGKNPWRKKWQPTPVFLPGNSHGQRSLVGYSPWGRKRVGHHLATKQQQQTTHCTQTSACSQGWSSQLQTFFFFFISWRLITLQYCSGFLSYIDMNQPWI